ncbi:MAG: hypothetical protein HYV26_23280 [Candidatus Hydrogenedentes bacterium]|nr:hypothetical protein [Candidatus Hydrogenedentota bacterium]MBI3119753.1 hypothetical protein [Candidatus Hydrogenedentota bacterium]
MAKQLQHEEVGAEHFEPMDLFCEDMLRQQQFFEENLDALLSKYRGRFISICRGEVLASGDDPQLVHAEARRMVRQGSEEKNPHPAVLTRMCERDEVQQGTYEALPAILRGSIQGE